MELRIEKFKKSFGDQVIWNNLTTTLRSGEIVSIQGRSGEGKTTFLRALNGLESLDTGEAFIDGAPISLLENQGLDRPFGMVFQAFHLFPNMTVWENITKAPLYHKLSEEATFDKANRLMDQLEITDLKKKKPHQLSGGQAQRVAIARAVMLNPKVLCFDEPTSALDQESISRFMKILTPLKEQGMLIIIVTHDSHFAETVSDRILTIEGGEFIEKKKRQDKGGWI